MADFKLTDLVQRVDQDKLVIPDFQRGFKWQTPDNRDPTEDKQLWASLRDSVLNRIFVSKKANAEARAQTPPNYLIKLTVEQRRVLQIPESFLGPLATPIKSDAFSAFLKDRYDLMKIDLIDHVRENL